MPRVILTGGPGVGKTTLIRALSARGCVVVEESAREIIRERKSRGLPARPGAMEFAYEVLRRDRFKYHQTAERGEWIFFDRSPLESIAMLAAATGASPAERSVLESEFSFHKLVFVLPPWAEIYVQDAERDHTFEHCEKVHDEVVSVYMGLGHEVAVVPLGSVVERVNYVIRALAASGALYLLKK